MDMNVKEKIVGVIRKNTLEALTEEYGADKAEKKLEEKIENAKKLFPVLKGNSFFDNIEYLVEYCWQHTPEDKRDDVDVGVAMSMLVYDDKETEYTDEEKELFDEKIDYSCVDDIILAKWDEFGDL